MKRTVLLAGVGSLLFAVSPARAGGGLELAERKQCLACHSVDKELTAPSFKAIARKFAKVANAQTMLEQAVMRGSDGAAYHWGNRKMPGGGARESVSQEEAAQLVQWILSRE